MGRLGKIVGVQRPPYKTGQLAYTEEEYQKLLIACEDPEDKMLLLIAVSLGPRREDIVRIRMDNINFTEGTLSYHEKKKKDKILTVPLGPKLRQELLFYRKNHNYIYLFPNQQKSSSTHMSGRTAYNRIHNLCRKAGVVPRPFHALRSTCIKLKQKEGWTVEQVAALVDDAVYTVQQHYSTPSHSELRQVMEEKEGI